MKQRPRNKIIKFCAYVLLFAAGGAIVNVAVAWGCASYLHPGFGNREPSRGCYVQIQGQLNWYYFYSIQSRSGAARISYACAFSKRPLDEFGRPIPSWVHNLQDSASSLTNQDSFMADAQGWPALTMCCLWIARQGRTGTTYSNGLLSWTIAVRRGIPLDKGLANLSGSPAQYVFACQERTRALPLQPIWPGFAINTVFYAAVLWLLFAAPGFVRRRIRARRGQCPACAYPIGTNPLCTECGKPLPKP